MVAGTKEHSPALQRTFYGRFAQRIRQLSAERRAFKILTLTFALAMAIPSVCGNWLVSSDMTVAELLSKCGKPSSQEVSTADVRNVYGAKVGTSTTQVWRYDRGSRAAPMIVTIVDGQIRSLERGK